MTIKRAHHLVSRCYQYCLSCTQTEPGNINQVGFLLNVLQRGDEDTLDNFNYALRKSGHVALAKATLGEPSKPDNFADKPGKYKLVEEARFYGTILAAIAPLLPGYTINMFFLNIICMFLHNPFAKFNVTNSIVMDKSSMSIIITFGGQRIIANFGRVNRSTLENCPFSWLYDHPGTGQAQCHTMC